MVKVSIIVPVYNVEEFLEECLDSLITQSLKDIEIICINDGSTDNSLKIMEEFQQKDKRIKIITQKNAGLSAARNSGLYIAKGEYIGFVDSDDWVSTDFYELLYNNAIRNDADISAGNVVYSENGKFRAKNFLSKQTFKVKKSKISTLTEKKIFMKAPVVWNKLFRKTLIDSLNLRFPVGLKFEDNYFSLITILCCKTIVIDEWPVYFYRMNGASITNTLSGDSEDVFHFFEVFECIDETVNSVDISDKDRHEFKLIIDEFKINLFYGWSNNLQGKYADEFKRKVKELFSELDISNNSYISDKTRKRYNKILNIKKPFFLNLAFFK